MLLMIVLNIIWADSYSIIHCHGNTTSWTPTGNRRRWRSKETWKDKVIVSTLMDGVVSSRYGQNTDGLQSCPHEEPDTRMLLHIKDAMNCGFKSAMIRTVDTYVVVLPVTHFQGLPNIEQLWIAFGTCNDFRYIPIHEIASALCPQMAKWVLFCHAFTGWDVTSYFTNRGKTSAWKTWLAWP